MGEGGHTSASCGYARVKGSTVSGVTLPLAPGSPPHAPLATCRGTPWCSSRCALVLVLVRLSCGHVREHSSVCHLTSGHTPGLSF